MADLKDSQNSHEEFLLKNTEKRKLEEKIAEKQRRFGGLLTREGAVKLLAMDKGFEERKQKEEEPSKLKDALEGEGFATVLVRVKQIFCPREFEKEGRRGRVCNILVGDDTAQATLVLWGDDVDFAERKLERNSCILAEGVAVKKPNGNGIQTHSELHSSMFTRISIAIAPFGMPDYSKGAKKLSELEEEDDFFARVSAKGQFAEFERNGEKRFVLNLTVEDETGKKTLVCWNRNAQIANFLKDGDVVKVEGVSLKNGELHASWDTHLIPHAKNHPLKELEFKPFAQLKEGESAFVQIVLQKLFEARVSRKCQNCGMPMAQEKEKCGECGGTPRQLFFITSQASDSFDPAQSARVVFFGEQAEELLGLKHTLVAKETIFALKRDFLEGKMLKLKVLAKQGQNGGLELVVKQLRSW